MRLQDRRSIAGFTLLEVLIAFAILAISLGVLLQVMSTSLSNSAEARSFAIAAALAESELERLGVADALVEGEFTGRFDETYRWHLTVAPPDSVSPDSMGVRLFALTLDVLWPDGLNERRIRVETLRLATAGDE